MIVTIFLNSLWQGAIIVAIAALASRFAARGSASTRYALWFAALLALAVIPIASSTDLLAFFSPIPDATVSAPIHAVSAATAHAANWTWLMLAWAAGAAFFVARLAYSYVRLARVLHNAFPSADLAPDVVLSRDVTIPIAAGLISPVIVLPYALPATMEASEMEQIIEHERAHIRRGDILTNFVQRTIEAALFFNPFIYVIGARLLREREIACDDIAVQKTGAPENYATSLMHLAQSMHRPRAALLSPSAVGSGHMLVGRIASILDGTSRRFKLNLILISVGIVAFVALAFFFASSMKLPPTQTPVSLRSGSSHSVASAACNRDVQVQNAAQPLFPDEARSKVAGPVTSLVEIVVGNTGLPLRAKIYHSSGNAQIDNAAVTAAMASAYSPKMVNCKGVSGAYLFRAEFDPQ